METSVIRWEVIRRRRTTGAQWNVFPGARFGIRGGVGMMDGGHTAIAQGIPETIDTQSIFSRGVRCFHTGGIMAALSERSTEVVRERMIAAKHSGSIVSYFPSNACAIPASITGPLAQIEIHFPGRGLRRQCKSFLRAGAFALGVGTELADVSAIRGGRQNAITGCSRQFLEIVRLFKMSVFT